jgi:hypothetical protein
MMLRKFHAGIALAIAIAAAPFALSRHGIVASNSSAANGSTGYFTLQPGATKTFPMGTEVRVCHDDGPPLDATIGEGTGMTRLLTGSMCVYSIGHNLTLKNTTSSPIRVHSSSVQKSGH